MSVEIFGEDSMNDSVLPSKARVSIIVPNYNHAKYLEKRLESILNQTYKDFELILLDDCSTDTSREIIEKYRTHEKISCIIYNDANSGSTFRQWIKGIDAANGKYIWIAESDDFASELFLEKTVFLIEKYSTPIVFTDSFLVDENDKELSDSFTHEALRKMTDEAYFEGNYFIKQFMMRGNCINNTSAVLFSKSAACFAINNCVCARGISHFRFCGDWFFWSSIILNSSVVFCADKLNFFRQHEQKVTRKADRLGLSYIEGLDVVCFLMEKLNLSFYEAFLLGGYFLEKINHDEKIEDEKIRHQCLNKWADIFPYAKHIKIIYRIYILIMDIRLKSKWVKKRVHERGVLGMLKYYLGKYT